MIHPWQQQLWTKLINQHHYGHAYLFYGVKGLGKRHLVAHFAARLLCSEAGEYACGTCKNCKLLAANNHPDIFYLDSLDDKEISIDKVREMVTFLSQTANYDGYKLVICNQLNLLNRSSANALLKSLEEPAGKSILLLVSDEISNLLPTIISRCQKISCPRASYQQAADYLYMRFPNLSATEIKQLLELSHNSPLLATELLQQNILEQRQIWTDGIKRLLKRQINIVDLAGKLQKSSAIMLFNWAIELVSNIIRYKLSADDKSSGAEDLSVVTRYLATKNNVDELFSIYQKLLMLRAKIVHRANLNPQLLLESMLLRVQSLG